MKNEMKEDQPQADQPQLTDWNIGGSFKQRAIESIRAELHHQIERIKTMGENWGMTEQEAIAELESLRQAARESIDAIKATMN